MAEFTTPLTLTTPNATGQRVRDAQWLLAGHNRFSATKDPVKPYEGRIDGQYGPVTVGATREAKFLLGYPEADVNGSFGQSLYNYLTKSDLPVTYQQVRAARLKALVKPIKVLALQTAITQLGTMEKPFGSNMQKYGAWYGLNGEPWCAIFDSWCISQHTKKPWKFSYVPTIVSNAQHGLYGTRITFAPQPGDLVAYTLNGEVNCHIEIYEKDINGTSFNAIGGNTGPTSISNGGEVARNIRYMYQVSHFISMSGLT